MDLTLVSLGLMDPLYIAFGWVMRLLYEIIGNYGLVIIVFTIFLRGIMIPLGIHQQKGMIKQQSLQGEINEIKRLYPDDKTKQSELQMELYKKNGASPLSGCLPSILQLIIIWPIFRIIQAPLKYIMQISTENLNSIGTYLNTVQVNDAALITAAHAKSAATMNIPILNALNANGSALATVVKNGWMRLDQLINVDFLGMNLGLTPSWKPADLFGQGTMEAYLPLLIIPLLVLITTLVQMRFARITTPNRKQKAEDKEREKLNPARQGQAPADNTESMMKSMNVIMPIFMLWTTFSMPSAMGLYWIVGNIMGIIQSLLIYFLFTKRIEKHEAEQRLLAK